MSLVAVPRTTAEDAGVTAVAAKRALQLCEAEPIVDRRDKVERIGDLSFNKRP